MPITDMTVEEIVSTLTRSRLFNVVVEGRDDIIAFRIMEKQIRKTVGDNVYLISAGGRSKLLQIFKKIKQEKIENCAFICDKDLWVFSGVPEIYDDPDLIKTDGYSIENDLLRDYPPQSLMDLEEEKKFEDEILYFSMWYSLEVSKALQGIECSLKCFAGQILDGERNIFDSDLDADIAAKELHELIRSDTAKLLRGKSLLQIALRQLARKGRSAKHTDKGFLEHAASANGDLFARIAREVREKAEKSISATGY